MANLNKFIGVGNLTRDPELKYTPSNVAVCNFGLAINRTWNSANGEAKTETLFIDCACFSGIAEALAKYKAKGDPILVEGYLKLDQWEDNAGNKRQKISLVANNVQFLHRAPEGGYGNQGGGYQGEEQPAAPAPRQQTRQQNNGGNRQNNSQSNAGPQRQQSQRRQAAPKNAPPANNQNDMPDDDAPPIGDEDIPF